MHSSQVKIQPIPNAKEEMKKHREYAAETFGKDERINIHVTSCDTKIQKLAMSGGIPYAGIHSRYFH